MRTIKVVADENVTRFSLGAGVMAVERFTAMIDDPELGCSVTLEAIVSGDRYRVSRLEIAGSDITGDLLRRLPVAEFVRSAAIKAAAESLLPATNEDATPKGLIDGFLEKGTATYRMATLVGAAATQEVADRFGVSRATAGRWIATARERDILGAAPRARSGETGPMLANKSVPKPPSSPKEG